MALPATTSKSTLPAYFNSISFTPIAALEEFRMAGDRMIILQVGRDGELKVRVKKDETRTVDKPSFTAHIVEVGKPRALFDEGTTKPRCKSDDSKVGVGDNGQDGTRHDCGTCQMAVFGSGKGNSQACKQTIVVGLAPARMWPTEDGVVAKKSMAWWFDISGVPYMQYPKNANYIVTDIGNLFKDGKYAFKKLVLRITASSFKRWTRCIDDMRALGDEWPLQGPVVNITTHTEQLTSSDGATNKVGLWSFEVSGEVGEQDQMTYMEAVKMADDGIVITEAGHDGDGIVRD